MILYNDEFQAFRVIVFACGNCLIHADQAEILHHMDRFILNLDNVPTCPNCGKKNPYVRIEGTGVIEGQQGG